MENNSFDTNDILNNLSIKEKIRLFNGEGSWTSYGKNIGLPIFCMSDGPHGLRKQNEEKYADLNNSNLATCFPTASCIASSWNKKSLYKLGQAIAKEAIYEKVDLMLGPGINIKRSPLCGRNFEYLSEDPYLTGTLASEYIKGMQNLGVGACLKHYAANNQEKRRQTCNSIIDERTLHEIYLRGFEIAVKNANPISIMTSYNRLNGEYVGASKTMITDILRNKWGFKGFVISDWGACINAATSIKAGMDLAMPDSYGYFDAALQKALADKIIEESDIEAANHRLLSSVKQMREWDLQHTDRSIDYKIQHRIALELAEDSAVLLKNENGFLPLKKEANPKIAVIGELAEFMKFQGGGSSHITTAEYPNALGSLTSLGFEVLYEKGYFSGFCDSRKKEKKNRPFIQPAINLANKAKKENLPVLFFCGLTEAYEGEGFDRQTMNLPEEQLKILEEVLKITSNVVIINFSGAPVTFPFADKVQAILQMYLCGEACGEAVADLVSGKVNPSGKLAESFPYKLEDLSYHENFAGEEDNIEYREGVFVGYRHYQKNNIPVAYEFGFGLSYTTFEYSNLKINNEAEIPTVSFNLKNTGNVAGSEIAQVYIEALNSIGQNGTNRPVKQLRGFEKITLEPGEEKTVSIQLDDITYCVYSCKKHDFVKIKGQYLVGVGSSSLNIKLSQEVAVDGEIFEEAVTPVDESFYIEKSVPRHTKGTFTVSDNLVDMAAGSKFVRRFLKFAEFVLVLVNKGKSREDPSLKIEISAVRENPVESLISVSNGAVTEKMVRILVKRANLRPESFKNKITK